MIIKIPNLVLTKATKPVARVDKRVLDVILRMKHDLIASKKPKGVGLAAPQIGLSMRVFITRPSEKSAINVYINPKITWISKNLVELNRPKPEPSSPHKGKKLEGCLSIPQVWGYLKRADKLRLSYLDIEGTMHENDFKGFEATIIQHEMDHLEGVLFTQRVLQQGEPFYRIEVNDKGKEELVEIEI